MEIKKIFMGNLDFGVTEDELKNLLSPYGTVAFIKINKKKGYAFAEFGNNEEAQKAVQGLNGQKFKDREIRASLEMKSGKAKALSIKKYKERGWNLSREKFRRTSDNQYLEEGSRDFPEGSEERESRSGSSWGKPKGRYPSKEKSSDYPRPLKKSWSGKPSYSSKAKRSGERGDQDRAPGREKREWTPKKPSYSGKPARRGESASPWGAPKKEWSSKKSSGSRG